MKIFAKILILLTLLSHQMMAQDRVVLLSSLENESIPFWANSSWDIKKVLESIFKRKMRTSNYDVVVIHQANQEDIYRELHNGKNKAVFWMSHSSNYSRFSGGLGYESTILDAEKINVSTLFGEVHPNIQYLGVLGCVAAPQVDKNKRVGLYDHNPNLRIYAKDRKTMAQASLRKSVNDFKKHMKLNLKPSQCVERTGHKLTIRRQIPLGADPSSIRSVRVENKGKVLALFPKGKPGEIQVKQIAWDLRFMAKENGLKLKVTTGLGNRAKGKDITIGKFQFGVEGVRGEWKLFADLVGQPIGHSFHTYRFKGRVGFTGTPFSEDIFNCFETK